MQPIQSKYRYKSCQHCIFYIKPFFNDKYEIGNYLGKCTKFIEIDSYTNQSQYKYAIQVRENENECGEDGIYYNQGEPVTTMDIPSI
jgi:hypothetical protein